MHPLLDHAIDHGLASLGDASGKEAQSEQITVPML